MDDGNGREFLQLQGDAFSDDGNILIITIASTGEKLLSMAN